MIPLVNNIRYFFNSKKYDDNSTILSKLIETIDKDSYLFDDDRQVKYYQYITDDWYEPIIIKIIDNKRTLILNENQYYDYNLLVYNENFKHEVIFMSKKQYEDLIFGLMVGCFDKKQKNMKTVKELINNQSLNLISNSNSIIDVANDFLNSDNFFTSETLKKNGTVNLNGIEYKYIVEKWLHDEKIKLYSIIVTILNENQDQFGYYFIDE